MAECGYRLIRTGKLGYEFEPCKKGEYQYRVEFISHKSFEKGQDYKRFLEQIGYKVHYKNANLNYSVGKIKWRPYGEGMGQIATSNGSYNKELLIVEKKNDGTPFEMHSTNSDRSKYFKPIRNAYLSICSLFIGLAVWKILVVKMIAFDSLIFLGLGLLFLIPVIKCQIRISKHAKKAKTEE